MHIHIRPVNSGDRTGQYAIDEYTVDGEWTGTTFKPNKIAAMSRAREIQKQYEPLPAVTQRQRRMLKLREIERDEE